MRHGTGGSKVRLAGVVGTVLLAGALIAACSSSSATSGTTTTTAGTTGSSSSNTASGSVIKIGAISTLTGPISSDFASFVPGIQAYLKVLDANGGVNGHPIQLAYNLDDGGSPTTFTQLAHTLIQQDNAFAVFTSTFWFTPNLFVQANVPTFGYNVSGNWAPQPNLFAAGGSTQDYNYVAPAPAYLIHQLKAKSVAVVSYGPAISSSYNACSAGAKQLAAGGINVGYTDLAAQLGGDFSAAVQKMQQAGTDFVMTCMQGSDNITMSRALQQYGLNIHQLWLNGYDNSLLAQYGSLMNGVYFNINGNVPFQAPKTYPGKYPGMANYLASMAKYEPKYQYDDVAIQGWQSADLLATGIKNTLNAGLPLTQANVINQINKINNYTANGLTTVTNWTTAHDLTQQSFPICSAFVKVQGTQFVPAVAAPPQTILCFNKVVDLKNPALATPQPGTPGT
jgi:ABC-type branched-subunit amino acid transport system substrate-binding protein